MKRITFIFIVLLMGVESVFAQSCTWIYSTEGNMWKESKIRLQLKPDKEPALKVDTTESIQKMGNLSQRTGMGCFEFVAL